MLAYKLFKVRKNGTIGPLFINRKLVIPIGVWMEAESHPTKGYTYRPFWHCTSEPVAPHLSEKGRRWYLIDIDGFEKMERPECQGGTWYLAERIFVIKPV